MRYSTIFAGLIAATAAAPLELPTADLPVSVPELPVDVESTLSSVNTPSLPVKRADLPVAVPELPVDVSGVLSSVKVPSVPTKRDDSADFDISRELDLDFPSLEDVEEVVDSAESDDSDDEDALHALPIERRVSVTVDETKVVDIVEEVLGLLGSLISVDALGVNSADLPVSAPSVSDVKDTAAAAATALPSVTRRATVTVNEQKVVSTVSSVIGLLQQLIGVDADVEGLVNSVEAVAKRQSVPSVPALVSGVDVSSTISQAISELTSLIN